MVIREDQWAKWWESGGGRQKAAGVSWTQVHIPASKPLGFDFCWPALHLAKIYCTCFNRSKLGPELKAFQCHQVLQIFWEVLSKATTLVPVLTVFEFIHQIECNGSDFHCHILLLTRNSKWKRNAIYFLSSWKFNSQRKQAMSRWKAKVNLNYIDS